MNHSGIKSTESEEKNMPLIILCGVPCSGKSTRSTQLQTFFEEKNIKVHIVGDHQLKVDKNIVYAESRKENELRSNLKSEMQRKINKDDVVILDSANYIKGYRYELFCVSKSARTTQCVVHCAVDKDTAMGWNEQRTDERYSSELLEALFMRFEPPATNNRWDSPLFLVHADEDLPTEQIHDALFKSKPLVPNQATQNQPLSSTNFLHELDNITQSAIKAIMDFQKTGTPGDTILIPGANEKYNLMKIMTLAELQRFRRQFISFTKSHPPDNISKIANMFVRFLNNSWQ